MKPNVLALLCIASVAALSGCGHSQHWQAKSYKHYQPGDGAIDLGDDEVVIRAGGQAEDAHVAADGQLTLGHRAIDTSEAGRAALRQYYVSAATFREHVVALGIEGAHFGLRTAKHVLKGLFDGSVDEAGDEAEKGGAEIEQRAYELCDRFRDAYKAQNTAAAAVPEFKPYAVISAKQVQECDDERKPRKDRDAVPDKSGDQA